jgi:deoxyribonuclease-4
MTKKLYIGAHSSIAMGYAQSLKSINAIDGNAVQIFLKSPRGGKAKPLDKEDAKEANDFLKKNSMILVGHCSYLLNFAKDPKDFPWAVESLIDDMNRMSELGGIGVVLHIGKYLEMKKEEAYENIKKSVSIVLEKSPDDVMVLFENTAGQGTEIGFKIDELKEIYDLFDSNQKKKIGFCLDTCHMFSAGYDISNEDGVNKFFKEFDNKIGIDKVKCVHFNDDKKELGSRLDRHEDIGFGTINVEGLKAFAIKASSYGLPLILETPTGHMDYKEQIEIVKSWF